MSISRCVLVVAAGLAAVAPAFGQTAGQRCNRGDVSNDPALVCHPTDDFEVFPARILNAKKGDVVVSADCGGMIGGLLRAADQDQRFSHSGIMLRNQTTIRHSTAAVERYADHAGSDGFDPEVLKYGWPGTITESVREAFERDVIRDPEGKDYHFQSFNRNSSVCPDDGSIIFPAVVKPPPPSEADDPAVRTALERIADEAENIRGHYRFFAYTDGALVGNPVFQAPASVTWAFLNAPEGTVCSEMIWSAAKRAGVPVEDPAVEAGDRPHPPDPAKLGLAVYSEQSRQDAGQYLYTSIYNKYYDSLSSSSVGRWFKRLLSDAPDDAANQISNCFAFDWCGDEPDKIFDGETNAKDSDRWRNPGVGVALSPDDITHWDPPPAGVYGLHEDMVFVPTRVVLIHRWFSPDCMDRCRQMREACAEAGREPGGPTPQECGRRVNACETDCRRRAGNSASPPPPPPPPPPPQTRAQCLDGCELMRQSCMEAGREPGGPTAQECGRRVHACQSRCPAR
jgi:hypothetical protein